MRRDFDYLSSLLTEFFGKSHIQNGLTIIATQNITGWEIWLQVEFARFLAHHESEPEWHRELPLQYDGRREKDKYYFKPDFLIRKKGWRLESYAALEMKQHPDAVACIGNMMNDLVKVSKMRQSQLDLRTYWALGVFRKEQKSYVRETLLQRAESANVLIEDDLLHLRVVPNTDYAYLLC